MNKDINKFVEEIFFYKGSLIKNSNKYREYIKSILDENHITDPIEAFVMGAVDAMIYDIACSLDFTKQKGKISDWSSWKMRRIFIKRLWNKR